jgi:hypothetical protein
MGFDRFPKVRWDDGVLIDTILYMNTLAQLVDRRMMSYRTALEALGFDFPNEKSSMEEEFDLVQSGLFGILGAPWQQAKNIQPNTMAPKGTPSTGRPKGQPAKDKDTQSKPKKSATSPNQQKRNEKIKQAASFNIKMVANLSASEYAALLDGAREALSDEDYAGFVEETAKYRFLTK